jgi:hypothetical protein
MKEGSAKWDWWRARMIGGRTNHWEEFLYASDLKILKEEALTD